MEERSAKGFELEETEKGSEIAVEMLGVENGFALEGVETSDLEPKILSPSIGSGCESCVPFVLEVPLALVSCCVEASCEILIPRIVLILPAFFLHVLDLHVKI